MLNRQSMFDDAAKHMVQQRSRAVHNGRCCYRTDDGRKCIIGAMIPDYAYKPQFDYGNYEQSRIETVLSSIDPKYGSPSADYGDTLFAVALQSLHDHATQRLDWESLRRELFANFQEFAKNYGLDFTVARRLLTREDDVPKSNKVPAFTVGGERNYERFEAKYPPGEFLDTL